MTAIVGLRNPYWDEIKDHVIEDGSLWGTPSIGGLSRSAVEAGTWRDGFDDRMQLRARRSELVARYSWTISDPASLAFVVEHSAGRIVDPMAGTGYWAHLLDQAGVDVVAYDADPVANQWHQGQQLWTLVMRMPGVESAAMHPDRTLLLSWPPCDRPDGVEVLRAYRGNRAIYIGEPQGGCTGDDDLHAELESSWEELASHTPVQWDGLHDVITVFGRCPQ